MSRCGVNRWGPGTTCERPINTEATKDMEARLAVMAKERESQDKMWISASEIPIQEISKTCPLSRSKQLTTTLK